MQTFKEYYIEEGKFSKAVAAGAIGLASLMPQSTNAAIPNNNSQISQNIQSSKSLSQDTDFVNHIKSVENSIMKGWDKRDRKWYPHKSFEGGTDTIAYGHKLTRDDINSGKFDNGIAMSEAEDLLLQDIKKHEDRVRRIMKNQYDVNYDTLSIPQKFLLTDYEYTGVLKKFPSFTVALLVGNKAEMIKQHERKSNGIPLQDRNARTADYINQNF